MSSHCKFCSSLWHITSAYKFQLVDLNLHLSRNIHSYIRSNCLNMETVGRRKKIKFLSYTTNLTSDKHCKSIRSVHYCCSELIFSHSYTPLYLQASTQLLVRCYPYLELQILEIELLASRVRHRNVLKTADDTSVFPRMQSMLPDIGHPRTHTRISAFHAYPNVCNPCLPKCSTSRFTLTLLVRWVTCQHLYTIQSK